MSIVLMGSTSGSVTLQEPAVAGSTVLSLPATTGTVGLTTSQIGMKNRIINGAMVIDQRNAGASVTPTANGTYTLDRWQVIISQSSKFSVQQNAGSVTPPAGFNSYLGVTSLAATSLGASDFFGVRQVFEGFNVADLNWGTANAQTVTLSFWVRSSLTGTFGGAFENDDNNRSYPYSYTISSANTWEYKTITIPGDTSGTWPKTNGANGKVYFSLGMGSTYSGTAGAWAASDFRSATGATSVVGTNGATFYITGVQLELGSAATTFDFRPYGTELALCQRYYYRFTNENYCISAFNNGTSTAAGTVAFKVTMRTPPTALEQSGTAGDYSIAHGTTATTCTSVPTFGSAGNNYAYVTFPASGSLTSGQGSMLRVLSPGYLAWSAEL